MNTLTLNLIHANNPSPAYWGALLGHLGKTGPDAEPVSLQTVLEVNGPDAAAWCLRLLDPPPTPRAPAADTARDQALAQVASIAAMAAALECDYDELEALRSERDDWVSDHDTVFADPAFEWRAQHPTQADELADLEDLAGECQYLDDAERAIDEDPLSVEVRSGWVNPHEDCGPPEEFRIVLCTGGPHVELQGDLQNGEPCCVRVLYRDWGDSGELFDFDREAVLTYCRQVVSV